MAAALACGASLGALGRASPALRAPLRGPPRRQRTAPPARRHVRSVAAAAGLTAEAEFDATTVGAALRRRFDVLERPASSNMTFDAAMRAFVEACILAYSLGVSEDFVKNELSQLAEGMAPEQVESLSRSLSLVFITITLCPSQSVRRWSTAAAVSDNTFNLWQGFVRLIVDGYFNQGMVWYSIQRLQLEQSAVLGRAEPAETVAERMSIVYHTLNTVSPKFPSRFD